MIKALIFDMDGTLYKSDAIHQKFAEAAYYTLASKRSIPLDRARQDIEQRRESMKGRYGSSVPYTLTLQSFDIPISIWHEYNISYFDPRDHLEPDPALQKALAVLERNFTLSVLTNNNQTQTERTLQALRVKDRFSRVFTYNTYHLLKPDITFFLRAAEDLRVPSAECCFIGDRFDVDLKPAQQVGMSIVEVQGPEDVYALPEFLLQGDHIQGILYRVRPLRAGMGKQGPGY